MADETLRAVIDFSVKGQGDIPKLKQEIAAMGQSADRSALQLAAIKAQAGFVESKMQQLARAVAAGDKSFDEAEKELKEYKDTLKDLPAPIDQAGKATTGLSNSIKNLVAGGALVAAGKALFDFGKQSLNAASDVQEMQSKFNTVFKDLSGSVTAELQTFADAANRSVFDLQGFAATLQDTFVPLGFAREEAADMSVQLVKLAEDLASFNNLNTADVVADLQSALVGNTETLRKYGVVANQAAIDQKALELGLEFTKGKMDAQTKSAAILALTLESTTDAQGDAIKTADSYANVSKGLDSAISDLSVAIGQNLIPIMTALKQASTENVSSAASYVKAINAIKGSMDAGNISYAEAVKQAAELNFTAKTGSDVLAEYAKAEEAAALANERFLNALKPTIDAASKADMVLTGQTEALTESQKATIAAVDAHNDMQEQYRMNTALAADYASAGEEVVITSEDLAEAERKRAEALAESEKAATAAAEAARKLEQAQAGTFVSAVKSSDAIGFFNESAAEMADRTVYLSGLTRDQSDILSDLQGEYDKAAQTVRDYTVGVDSVGISQEEQAKKVEEATARMNELQEAMNPLLSVQGEYANVTGQSTINQDAVNQALFDAAQAAGASASELAILGGALGLYSEEAVEAALQTAIIQTKINELAAAYADGSIGVGAMRAELTGFIDELNNAPDTAAIIPDVSMAVEGFGSAREQALLAAEGYGETADGAVTLDEASAALNETLGETITSTADLQAGYSGITDEMVALQKEAYGVNVAIAAIPKEVDIVVNYHTTGSAPSASSGQASGGAGPGFAEGTGGQFATVPAGFPNDSYNIGLSSGEKFMVIPAGGGGNTTNNNSTSLTANINVGSPTEYVDPLKQALRETGIRGF